MTALGTPAHGPQVRARRLGPVVVAGKSGKKERNSVNPHNPFTTPTTYESVQPSKWIFQQSGRLSLISATVATHTKCGFLRSTASSRMPTLICGGCPVMRVKVSQNPLYIPRCLFPTKTHRGAVDVRSLVHFDMVFAQRLQLLHNTQPQNVCADLLFQFLQAATRRLTWRDDTERI